MSISTYVGLEKSWQDELSEYDSYVDDMSDIGLKDTTQEFKISDKGVA